MSQLRKTVLVVAEDDEFRATLADFLNVAGYSVGTALSGAAALKWLDQLPRESGPAVMLLDMQKDPREPRMLLEIAARDPRYSLVPIIALAGTDTEAAVAEEFRVVRAVLRKPLDLRQLHHALGLAMAAAAQPVLIWPPAR